MRERKRRVRKEVKKEVRKKRRRRRKSRQKWEELRNQSLLVKKRRRNQKRKKKVRSYGVLVRIFIFSLVRMLIFSLKARYIFFSYLLHVAICRRYLNDLTSQCTSCTCMRYTTYM